MKFKRHTLIRKKCPICGGKPYFFARHPDQFNKQVHLMKCENCGHGFYFETYDNRQLNLLYDEKYATSYLDESTEHLNRKKQYDLDVELLRNYVASENFNVIDVGCSSGEYLEAMPETWTKYGMEVNEFLREKLKKEKPRYKIYSSLAEIDTFFDLVTLRGVIEHIPEHDELVEFLQEKVKPDGFVYISATPNFDSICSRLYKQHWSQVVCPEHIHQFTPTSLQILLKEADFVCKVISYPYIETPYSNWNSDAQNFLNQTAEIGNFKKETSLSKHPFPGNMLSILFQKISQAR